MKINKLERVLIVFIVISLIALLNAFRFDSGSIEESISLTVGYVMFMPTLLYGIVKPKEDLVFPKSWHRAGSILILVVLIFWTVKVWLW